MTVKSVIDSRGKFVTAFTKITKSRVELWTSVHPAAILIIPNEFFISIYREKMKSEGSCYSSIHHGFILDALNTGLDFTETIKYKVDI